MPLVRPGKTRFQAEPANDGVSTQPNADSILDGYFKAFDKRGPADDDGLFSDAMDRVREYFVGDSDGHAACLVCLEDLHPADPVWHCSGIATSCGCYAIIHLSCIQAWARQQLYRPTNSNAPDVQHAWGCPKCRREYREIPSVYSCFCGSTRDPPFNPWNAPHSCGERCSAANPSCGHTCLLLCHAGPHPPCPLMIEAKCWCGGTLRARRCGQPGYSCDQPCGKDPPGCHHQCKAICHPGECSPCDERLTVTCRCGRSIHTDVKCSQRDSVLCTETCDRLLACNVHTCSRACCPGTCVLDPCPFATSRTCPCGKTKSDAGLECGAAVPPCGATCDKLLPCGLHRCSERCHSGDCPVTCRQPVEKTCRCGSTTRTVQCSEELRCERRCTRMRSCDRHPCKRRCCDGTCPPCTETCNRRRRCGTHRCLGPCHPGNCAPCPLTAKISCACGRTGYQVPCGRESTAPPPACRHPCIVPPVCRHRESGVSPLLHRCHFGACPGVNDLPPCPLPCGTTLPCGHTCHATTCHDPPPPAVSLYASPPPPVALGEEVSKKRAAQLPAPPAATLAASAAIEVLEGLTRASGRHGNAFLSSPCPPCQHTVKVRCLGRHVEKDMACSSAGPFACNEACGKPLACGRHVCMARCHDPETTPCDECQLPCELHSRACAHPCPHGKCHSGDCGPCQVLITKPCCCGKTSLYFPCHKEQLGIPADELVCDRICGKPFPLCPHTCGAQCHVSSCPGAHHCEVEVTLRCSCKRTKKKYSCHEVHAMLKAKGFGTGAYADLPRGLLPCGSECVATRRKDDAGVETNTETNTALGKQVGREKESQTARAERNGSANFSAGPQKMTRERKKESGKRKDSSAMQRAVQAVLLILLVIGPLCIGWLLQRLLRSADQAAQRAWKPDNAL